MKKVKETPEERKKRLELSKAVQQQVMPDKTKYKRKPKYGKETYSDQ